MYSIDPHVYAVNQTISKIAHGELEVVTRLQMPSTLVSTAECDVYANALDYTLKEVPFDVPLEAAVDAVAKYIKKYRQDHFGH